MTESVAFATREELETWLAKHHADGAELWVRVYKKQSGTPSVDWNDCVVAALAWGWIDGQKRALDEVSFLQRLTPRRAKSAWSTRNREIAEKLIAEGRMKPPGLFQVEAARGDGRWESTYAGSASMVMPEEFLAELKKNRAAKKFFDTLDRANQFSIYYRLTTAKREETRKKRMVDIIAMLARGERFH